MSHPQRLRCGKDQQTHALPPPAQDSPLRPQWFLPVPPPLTSLPTLSRAPRWPRSLWHPPVWSPGALVPHRAPCKGRESALGTPTSLLETPVSTGEARRRPGVQTSESQQAQLALRVLGPLTKERTLSSVEAHVPECACSGSAPRRRGPLPAPPTLPPASVVMASVVRPSQHRTRTGPPLTWSPLSLQGRGCIICLHCPAYSDP